MKRSRLVLVLAMLSSFCPLALATTRNAASCSQSDVQSALDAAVDGDIVSVPAGSCTWSGNVTLDNKNITLQGAGHGCSSVDVNSCTGTRTDITVGGTVGVWVWDDTKPFRITGFKFNRAGSVDSGTIMINKRESYRDNKNSTGWRIDHVYFNGNVRHVMMYGVANYGLVDHAYFYTPIGSQTFQYRAQGTGETDGSANLATLSGTKARNLPLSLGTADALYIEDSEFFCNTWQGSQNVGDGTAGQRIVIRHNIIRGLMLEDHGACSGACRGTLQYEIYDNDFYPYDWNGSSGWMWAAIRLRGGTGVIFNNRFHGTWDSGAGELFFDNQRSKYPIPGDCAAPVATRCDGTASIDGNTGYMGWPCLDQIGRGSGAPGKEESWPVLLWNNVNVTNGNAAAPRVQDDSGNPAPHQADHLQNNRDWCLPSCSGTSCTTTCNNVSQSYTAYQYPHPLQSGGTTPAPSAPKNLRIMP